MTTRGPTLANMQRNLRGNMGYDDEDFESDDLAPAHGCFNGLALTFAAVLFIASVIAIVWVWPP